MFRTQLLYNCMVNVQKFQTLLFLFSNKMLVDRDRIHKMLLRITNREDPDQTDSVEAVWSGYALFVKACLASNWCLKFRIFIVHN